ncbi:phage tail assembly protein [Methylobacterium brachiatum]|uniref:phage tail assembly protein n=1 Tax=Methylobacterium brachiatum TaxID=269660 RepID=UPI0008DEF851|nr:phage tail assembly protein [Methylobacterium brachiatum]SFJ67899.1 Phage tail assembly chaperone protein, E, or 41 or 14 [Methylobacterium brachiatum]
MDGFTDVPQQQPAPQPAAAPAQAPAGVNPWAVKVTLSKPIEIADANGHVLRRIDELFFREPTAMDIIEVGGNPVHMDVFADDPSSTIRFDGRQMSAMIARLSNTPPPFIGKMAPSDWTYCAWQLAGFFLPAQPRS